MTPTLTSTIRADIQARFADGQAFTLLDFHQCQNRRKVTHVLEALASSAKFLRKVGKFDSKLPCCPPMNRYQVASAELSAANIEDAEPPPGSITIWHPMATPPVNSGIYQIQRVGSNAIERCHWDGYGWGTLPWVYVRVWRGVTR